MGYPTQVTYAGNEHKAQLDAVSYQGSAQNLA